MIHSVLFP